MKGDQVMHRYGGRQKASRGTHQQVANPSNEDLDNLDRDIRLHLIRTDIVRDQGQRPNISAVQRGQ